MNQKVIMILEDNDERIRGFEAAIQMLGDNFQMLLWKSANQLIQDCKAEMPHPTLISLDHDLVPTDGSTLDPGDGLQVAQFLSALKPICPVIIHTTNTERRWSMFNEFRFGHWTAEIVAPIGTEWIHQSWLPRARALTKS